MNDRAGRDCVDKIVDQYQIVAGRSPAEEQVRQSPYERDVESETPVKGTIPIFPYSIKKLL